MAERTPQDDTTEDQRPASMRRRVDFDTTHGPTVAPVTAEPDCPSCDTCGSMPCNGGCRTGEWAGEERHVCADEDACRAIVNREPGAPVTAEGLRERLINVVTKWALMYPLGNWGIWSTAAGASRDQLAGIAEDIAAGWGRDIADRVLAALAGDPGDLREQLAAEMRKHGLVKSTFSGDRCACGGVATDWGEHFAAAAMSVRWEHEAQLAAENATLRARAEHAEGELSSRIEQHQRAVNRATTAETAIAAVRADCTTIAAQHLPGADLDHQTWLEGSRAQATRVLNILKAAGLDGGQ